MSINSFIYANSKKGVIEVERIYSKVEPDLLLLAIGRHTDIDKSRTDFSPDHEYMQVSAKKLSKGTSFLPHKHNKILRTSDLTQEAWVFLSGKVTARFWDIDDSIIFETDLGPGDLAVVFRGGHSFEVLEDNTILYEFKTGPYYGQEKDKTYILEGKSE